MSPELQNIITNAELTLIPLAVTALGLWLRQKISELKQKDTTQQTQMDANTTAVVQLHDTVKANAILSPTASPPPPLPPELSPAPNAVPPPQKLP
jgi:hypothetical protein